MKTSIIKDVVYDVLDKEYRFPLDVLDKIIDQYQNKALKIIESAKEFGDDETENDVRILREKELSNLTSAIEKVIEIYDPLPITYLKDFFNISLELVNRSQDINIIKNIIFITCTLFQQHFVFPDNTADYFTKFALSDDIKIQKLSLSLLKKLSNKIRIHNVHDLLSIANNLDIKPIFNNLEDLDTKLNSNTGSSNELKKLSESSLKIKRKGDDYVTIRLEIVEIVENTINAFQISNEDNYALQVLKKREPRIP